MRGVEGDHPPAHPALNPLEKDDIYLGLVENYLVNFGLFVLGLEIYSQLNDKESDWAYRVYAKLLFESGNYDEAVQT